MICAEKAMCLAVRVIFAVDSRWSHRATSSLAFEHAS